MPGKRVLFKTQAEIQARAKEVSSALVQNLPELINHPSNCLILVVLNGGVGWYMNLSSSLHDLGVDIPVTYMKSSRYGDKQSGKEKADLHFLEPTKLENKHILLIEDLVDEGVTLKTIVEKLEEFSPLSVTISALFDKAVNRVADVPGLDDRYIGFSAPGMWLDGHQIDTEEFKRLDRDVYYNTEE